MPSTKTPAVLVALFLSSSAFAAPPAAPADTPTAVQLDGAAPVPTGAQTQDVTPLNAVLKAHVREGRVDYVGLGADADARKQLAGFLADAATLPENEPLASWINVYNGMVIALVLERYPIASVMDVPNFFKDLKRPIAGSERSLDDIENTIIRPRFRDARVHFALNCGALSCPPLPAEAFVQSRLDAQLDAVSRAAVNDPHHVKMVDGSLHVSELFFWFQADFERDAGSVITWIQRYAEAGPLDALTKDTPLVKQPYDWKLGAAGKP